MRIPALLALLVSLPAYACPQLAGSYTCKFPDGSTETVDLQQHLKDGITVFTYNGSSIATDNAPHQIPDDDSVREGMVRSWCDDDVTLKSRLTGQYWSNGAYFGDLTMDMGFSMNGEGLHEFSVGEVVNAGGKIPLKTDVTCADK